MRRGWHVPLLTVAAVIALAQGALAYAPVGWDQKGPFETCLQEAMEDWIRARAEQLANEDFSTPLNDSVAARWGVQIISQCKASVGSAHPNSEERFMRYLTRWHQHVFDAAMEIKRKGQSD